MRDQVGYCWEYRFAAISVYLPGIEHIRADMRALYRALDQLLWPVAGRWNESLRRRVAGRVLAQRQDQVAQVFRVDQATPTFIRDECVANDGHFTLAGTRSGAIHPVPNTDGVVFRSPRLR
jgi:hypothetical protein